MKAISLESPYWRDAKANGVDRATLEAQVENTAHEALAVLPSELAFTNIMLEPTVAAYVIPETGCMGMTYDKTHVSLTFDPSLPYGKESLEKHLRSTTFHELVHAVTFGHDPWQPGVLFGVVSEGLATVFERDYANADPLWGRYEDDDTMREWLKELQKLPATEQKDRRYFVEHPDGRKWIVYKTGTWLVDKLIDSGDDLFDLMELSHQDILDKISKL